MYKTILLHLDHSPACLARLGAAAQLARRHAAHLVGVAASGRPPLDHFGDGVAPGYALPPFDDEAARRAAQALLKNFDEAAAALGVDARESRLCDCTVDIAMMRQSRYCDLIVLGQGAMTSASAFLTTRLASYLAVQGGSPVLVVPERGAAQPLGQSILVGWNGSKEARCAINAALPLLKEAAKVRLVVFNPLGTNADHGEEPGADIAVVLARHGVQVEVLCRQTDDEPGAALHTLADQVGADLIVAGAHGRSRLYEWIAGHSTHNLLHGMRVPVLIAH